MDENYIKLELNGFLMNAGILGFIKLLRYEKAREGVDYILDDFEVLISKEYLLKTDLAQAYIDTMIAEFYEQTHYPKLLSDIQKIYDATERLSEKITKDEKSTLTNLYNEVVGNESPLKAASFKSAYVAIKEKEGFEMKDFIDAVTKEKDLKEKAKKLHELEATLKIPYVKEILCLKGIAYRVLNRFWNNKAFLTKNTKVDMKMLLERDITDHFAMMINGDVKPSKTKVCAECDSPYVDDKVMGLSVMEFMMDDIKRKPSAFWNFDTSGSYLCAKCAFTYLLVPLAFSLVRVESFGTNKTKLGMIFANSSSSVYSLIKANERNKDLDDISIQRFYSNLATNFIETQQFQTNNIQIITRPLEDRTTYGFSIITKDALSLMKESNKALTALANSYSFKLSSGEYFDIFGQTLGNILNGQNQYQLMNTLIHHYLREDEQVRKNIKYNISKVFDVQLTKNQLSLQNLKGGEWMTEKQLYFATKNAKEDGNALRIHLEHVAKKGTDSVIYPLLNALKTGNKYDFLNLIIRLHGTYKVQLSSDFIKGINDERLFNDIAYAYLLGLKGVYEYKKEEKNGGDENEK